MKLPATILALLLLTGCESSAPPKPAPPIDTSTKEAEPDFWLAKPAVADVTYSDFDKLWRSCEKTALDYQFHLDRRDYRLGVLTTQPLVSKQFFEVWRKDSGDIYDVAQNSLQTISRTIRFDIRRQDDGSFIASPKVLVWRSSELERRITTVSQFRYIFTPTDPQAGTQEVYADRAANIPQRYWYVIGRDEDMEKDLAKEVKGLLRD